MPHQAGPRRRSRRRAVLFAAAVLAVLGGGFNALTAGPGPVGQPMAGTSERTDTSVPTGPNAVPAPAPSPVAAAGGESPASPSPASAAEPTTAAPQAPAPDPAAPAASALALVAELEVKGRAPRTGYERDLFAYRAYDQDRNGCDIRNDVLRRDLVGVVIGAGTNGCVVESGTLPDPYSGASIDFVRGSATSGAVQIDHVVALSDAWQKGAQSWDGSTMREFGNDPLNLLAADGALNAQKGDGDTATWLPPNNAFRCEYVARQVAVKREYDLWVTAAEQEAMVRVLHGCPAQPLPGRTTAPLMPELAAEAPAAAPVPPPGAHAGDPRFDSCKDAKAAGYGPYVVGADPEYDWYRDGDSDGTVCEG